MTVVWRTAVHFALCPAGFELVDPSPDEGLLVVVNFPVHLLKAVEAGLRTAELRAERAAD